MVDGTFCVLEAARRDGVMRLVYVASSSCYGIPSRYQAFGIAAHRADSKASRRAGLHLRRYFQDSPRSRIGTEGKLRRRRAPHEGEYRLLARCAGVDCIAHRQRNT